MFFAVSPSEADLSVTHRAFTIARSVTKSTVPFGPRDLPIFQTSGVSPSPDLLLVSLFPGTAGIVRPAACGRYLSLGLMPRIVKPLTPNSTCLVSPHLDQLGPLPVRTIGPGPID
jgi:hypothetical protein